MYGLFCDGLEVGVEVEPEDRCRCLKVEVDEENGEENGGIEAVIREIEVEVWGAGSESLKSG